MILHAHHSGHPIGCWNARASDFFRILPWRMILQCLMVSILFSVSCSSAIKKKTLYPTIAVWDLENRSALSAVSPDAGELFAMQVTEVIKKSGIHRVVEREQIIATLEELNMGTTSLVDENTRLRLGRLVGAQLMIFGTYQVFSEAIRIDLRLVEVETGKILKAVSNASHAGDMDVWLKTIREAASTLTLHKQNGQSD